MTDIDVTDVEPDGDDIAWARDDLPNANDEEVYEVALRRATERAREPCIICGLAPCECDRLYDSWKERNL